MPDYMAGASRRQVRGLVTVRMAAHLLRIDRQNVYAAIWRGALRAMKYKGKWRIPQCEIQRYAAQRRKQGMRK